MSLTLAPRAKFTLSRALFRENVGPSPGTVDPIFHGKKTGDFLVFTVRVSAVSSPEKMATFLFINVAFIHFSRSLGCRPLFPACKKFAAPLVGAPFWGPLFGRTCCTCLNPPLLTPK